MENKIFDPDICAKSDFKKILCITPVINTELHCATKTDEKNLLLQQPKKKKSNFTMSLESDFFCLFQMCSRTLVPARAGGSCLYN